MKRLIIYLVLLIMVFLSISSTDIEDYPMFYEKVRTTLVVNDSTILLGALKVGENSEPIDSVKIINDTIYTYYSNFTSKQVADPTGNPVLKSVTVDDTTRWGHYNNILLSVTTDDTTRWGYYNNILLNVDADDTTKWGTYNLILQNVNETDTTNWGSFIGSVAEAITPEDTALWNAAVAGGDNWGSQYVRSNNTLSGNGTYFDSLKVDTSIIATKNYVEEYQQIGTSTSTELLYNNAGSIDGAPVAFIDGGGSGYTLKLGKGATSEPTADDMDFYADWSYTFYNDQDFQNEFVSFWFNRTNVTQFPNNMLWKSSIDTLATKANYRSYVSGLFSGLTNQGLLFNDNGNLNTNSDLLFVEDKLRYHNTFTVDTVITKGEFRVNSDFKLFDSYRTSGFNAYDIVNTTNYLYTIQGGSPGFDKYTINNGAIEYLGETGTNWSDVFFSATTDNSYIYTGGLFFGSSFSFTVEANGDLTKLDSIQTGLKVYNLDLQDDTLYMATDSGAVVYTVSSGIYQSRLDKKKQGTEDYVDVVVDGDLIFFAASNTGVVSYKSNSGVLTYVDTKRTGSDNYQNVFIHGNYLVAVTYESAVETYTYTSQGFLTLRDRNTNFNGYKGTTDPSGNLFIAEASNGLGLGTIDVNGDITYTGNIDRGFTWDVFYQDNYIYTSYRSGTSFGGLESFAFDIDYVFINTDSTVIDTRTVIGSSTDTNFFKGQIRYKDTFWDDLRFPVSTLNPVGLANDADIDDASSFMGTLLFDPTATEICVGQAQMPHKWKPETPIHVHVHWSPTSTNTGNVLWRLEYQIANINGTFPGSYTTLDLLDAGDGITNKHQLASFSDIDMTGFIESCVVIWKISRIGGDGTDTYTGDARLVEVDIHYEVEKPGSNEANVTL